MARTATKKMARNGSRRTGPSLNQIGGTYLLLVFNPPCRFLQLDLGPMYRSLALLMGRASHKG
jgi:hypothetical protein